MARASSGETTKGCDDLGFGYEVDGGWLGNGM